MTNNTFYISRFIALVILVVLSPLFVILFIVVKSSSRGPFLFRQKRMGKDKKTFWIYKIRTMVEGAESLKSKVQGLNEADGPVFKIRNDPRYTVIGKFLSHSALDELPQLINVLKGEMAFVGPRPLPFSEANKIPAKYATRFSVLPGMTSSWIINGAHSLSFREWMELDCEYALNRDIFTDFKILLSTVWVVFTAIFPQLKSR